MVWDGLRRLWDGLRWSEMVMRWFLCIFMFWVQLGCKAHCLIPLSTFVANMVPLEMKIAALETVEMVLRWFEMVWDGYEMVLMYFRAFWFNWGAKHIVWCLWVLLWLTRYPPEMKVAALETVEMVMRWFEMVMRWFWDGFGVFSCFWIQLGCKTHCLMYLRTFCGL